MGQTMVDAETIEAPTFDELKPLQQFNTVGDGGVDGSDFHHQNIFHNYPGHEGCQTACEGDHVTFETCQAKYYCEWDVGKCWSAVGPDPCPESKEAMYDMWEDHYDDYETGLHHWLDGFPASFDNYAYPGTIGCESTCEGINMDEKTCGSMFFCEWDEGKCWSAVGPNECPQTVHDMHELWYEYVHKHPSPTASPPPPRRALSLGSLPSQPPRAPPNPPRRCSTLADTPRRRPRQRTMRRDTSWRRPRRCTTTLKATWLCRSRRLFPCCTTRRATPRRSPPRTSTPRGMSW